MSEHGSSQSGPRNGPRFHGYDPREAYVTPGGCHNEVFGTGQSMAVASQDLEMDPDFRDMVSERHKRRLGVSQIGV